MTLTLNVQGICQGNIIAPAITKNVDWAMNYGDSSITGDHINQFSCPGVIPTPSFTMSLSDWRFSMSSGSNTVTWTISDFVADASYTITVIATLQSPHT